MQQCFIKGYSFFRRTVCPFLLITGLPGTVFVLWFTATQLGGSFTMLADHFRAVGFFQALRGMIVPHFLGSRIAWTMFALFVTVQLFLLRLIPGERIEGPVSPKGHVPIYRDNGLACFGLTMFLYLGASAGLGLFSPALIFDHFADLLGVLNLVALSLCVVLYIKGRIAPSSPDFSHTGNIIFDYYWGTELYPRIAGFDIKQVTNCRTGMMGWAVIIVSFAAKQKELGGLTDAMCVSVALQLIYIAKFFWWERGYFRSLDIMHDRAGFYICWGCLVWIPVFYTIHTLYQVKQPNHLGTPLAIAIFLMGAVAIFINTQADAQRMRVRATGGNTLVAGKAPVLVRAHYTTADGQQRESILLASGWWGVSRHFHYVPEILAALAWSIPAGTSHLMPYLYVLFLAVLLFDRAFRDDKRCAAKYGKDWDVYKAKVPWKFIPGIM